MAEADLSQWAVKYRSQSLEELLAEPKLKKRIADRIVKQDEHAYLLTGPTGCGKSTVSGLLTYGYLGLPYGTKSRDILRHNCPEDPSVAAIRKIVAGARMLPQNKWRIVILEEAHVLREDAASPLLLGIENSSATTMWQIITNKPEKLLKTLAKRCYSIQMELADPIALAKHLFWILEQEGAMTDWERGDRVKLCKSLVFAAGQEPRQAIQLLKIASDEAPEHENIDTLLKSPSLQTPQMSLDISSIKIILLMMLAHEGVGKELLKKILTAASTQEGFALMRRLQWFSRLLLVERSTGIAQPGSYLFNNEARSIRLLESQSNEAAVQTLGLTLSAMINAESTMQNFALDPNAVLISTLWKLHYAIAHGQPIKN